MNDKIKIHTLEQRVIILLEQNRKLVIQNEKLKKKVMYYKNMIDLFCKGEDGNETQSI